MPQALDRRPAIAVVSAAVKPDHQAEPVGCVECGRVQTAPVARGWRAYLTVDEDEPAEAVVYCPDCSLREFGETGESLRQ
jgi:hypothetical protein